MTDGLLTILVKEILQTTVSLGDRFLGLCPWIARLTLALTAIVAVIGIYLWIAFGSQGAGPILALLGSLFFIFCMATEIYYRRVTRSTMYGSR